MAKKHGFITWVDDLPKVIKIILALPLLGSFWGIYRIVKGIVDGNVLHIIIGIIWFLSGWAILWIIDLIWLIVWDRLLFV